MALSLAFKASLNSTGTHITITDTTGAYSATNTGGWNTTGGDPNIAPAAVTAVTLTITYSNETVQTATLDKTEIPASVTGNFSYTAIKLEGYVDGIATVNYKITTSTTSYEAEIKQLYACNIRKCINQMWVKIACETCNGNCDLVNLIDDANLAEGLYKALISGAASCDSACVNKILTSLNNLCSWKDCNC